MAKNYREVLSGASSFLETEGKEGYSIYYVFFERKGWNKTDWLLHMEEAISLEETAQIEADLKELLNDYPPQYLIGTTEFYDARFLVTPATLIPRPETEELVELCLKEVSLPQAKVVDVGTGTGAIAISLKRARPAWQVTGVDISEAALAVAKENGQRLAPEVMFQTSDVLKGLDQQVYDVIISNPPYISQEEWRVMDASVKKFEPHQALFAENQGLAIYQQLAQEAPAHLTKEGQIFLEIGYQQGERVKQIFEQAFPEKEVTIHQDLAGLDRMVMVK